MEEVLVMVDIEDKAEEGAGDKMPSRVLIPTEDNAGKVLADHFGRAPYFAIFDIDDFDKIIEERVHENASAHRGGQGHAHNNVLSLKPQVVIVKGMGPRGIKSFQEAKIAVLRADNDAVEKVLDSFVTGKLSELTEGCADSHHK